jgi:hypothetical protein
LLNSFLWFFSFYLNAVIVFFKFYFGHLLDYEKP